MPAHQDSYIFLYCEGTRSYRHTYSTHWGKTHRLSAFCWIPGSVGSRHPHHLTCSKEFRWGLD